MYTNFPPLEPLSPNEGPFPLSFAQKRLWFLDQWEPDSSAYNVPHTWRLQGPLNKSALEASLDHLIARHESFRTTFQSVEENPVQVIAPPGNISLPFVDVSEMASGDREATIEHWTEEILHRPFALTTGPLWRAMILRVQPDDHLFLLGFHHIITDGFSLSIFFRELAALYQAHIQEKSLDLPSLPLTYADYAVWQQECLQGEVLEQSLSYWRKQLADAPPSLALPTDASRPTHFSYRGARESFTIPPRTTKAIKALSSREHSTLFMTLLAAFQVLLWRYSGQRDILVGTPIAGRTQIELEDLIGFFVNTLVFRTRFQGQPTFRDVLAQVRDTCLDAYDHQDLPFEKIVEELLPTRDPSRHPIFQVMFQVFMKDPDSQLHLEGLKVEKIEPVIQTAKFDLYCKFNERDGSMQGTIEYLTDIFAPQTIRRLISHYQVLLEKLVEDLTGPLTRLSFLTPSEQKCLLEEWNPLPQPTVHPGGLHELVEEQVRRTPDSLALRQEGDHLTYTQLNAVADRWAAALLTLGVGPGVSVALWAERHLEVPIGILAVLKAGGVVVPLDPTYPPDRIQWIVEETQSSFLLTGQDGALKQGPQFGGRTITFSELSAMAKVGDQPKAVQIREDHPLYILYTSGSTGRPKGVVVPHRTLHNLVAWHRQHHRVRAGTISLHFSPFVFDVAWQELFTTWACGGTLVLLSESCRRDATQWVEIVKEEQVEHMFLPTVALHQLADLQEQITSLPQQLKEIFVAGEALHVTPNLTALMGRFTNCQLHNQYGPTETHVVTNESLPQSPEEWPVFPSIGRPLENVQVYVFDEWMQPVPIGVEGELYVGGLSLALGYQQGRSRTAEVFFPHPNSPEPGKRLYRTGDRGRLKPDGRIEFVGRRDHQIKFRGYRIELGEIEGTLRRHPSVQGAVVLFREDTPGDKQLVAYVENLAGTQGDPVTFSSYLKSTLPEYMIPGAWVMVDHFPLTGSGKVNRQALPPPDPAHRTWAINSESPRTPLEEAIAEIWTKILKVEAVGVHDNFFELGGHSLMATQVVVRLRNFLQTPVSLRTLFDHPTIAELAQELETQGQQ